MVNYGIRQDKHLRRRSWSRHGILRKEKKMEFFSPHWYRLRGPQSTSASVSLVSLPCTFKPTRSPCLRPSQTPRATSLLKKSNFPSAGIQLCRCSTVQTSRAWKTCASVSYPDSQADSRIESTNESLSIWTLCLGVGAGCRKLCISGLRRWRVHQRAHRPICWVAISSSLTLWIRQIGIQLFG